MNREIINKYLNALGAKNMPSFLEKYLDVPSLVRLKNVGYFCGMDFASSDIYDFKEKISRYDHSLSVALMTWMLTKDKNATLAGLFHDISTPCFSHVIDYMNKDYVNQESTEENTLDIMLGDKVLCEYLLSDDIDVRAISDFKRYGIVDKDRPMLCVDRIDGIILTGLFWTKSIDIDTVLKIILDLDVFVNESFELEVGLKSDDICNMLIATNCIIDEYCHSKEDNYMMELLASITRRAIEIGIISYDSLFVLTEDVLIKLLDSSDDLVISKLMSEFRNIKLDDIPDIELPLVKRREIKPLVKSKRKI